MTEYITLVNTNMSACVKTAMLSVQETARGQSHWDAAKVQNWLQRMGNKNLPVVAPERLIWTLTLPLAAGSGPGRKLKFEEEWVWKWARNWSQCTPALWYSWRVPRVLEMRGRRWTLMLSGQFVWTHPLEYYHTDSLQPIWINSNNAETPSTPPDTLSTGGLCMRQYLHYTRTQIMCSNSYKCSNS